MKISSFFPQAEGPQPMQCCSQHGECPSTRVSHSLSWTLSRYQRTWTRGRSKHDGKLVGSQECPGALERGITMERKEPLKTLFFDFPSAGLLWRLSRLSPSTQMEISPLTKWIKYDTTLCAIPLLDFVIKLPSFCQHRHTVELL